MTRSGFKLFASAFVLGAGVISGFQPAIAQTGTAFSGISSSDNSKKPIDIESDRLEVDDKTQLAIFTGSVSATQGDYNLKSARLEVTYEHAKNKDEEDAANDKPSVKHAKATPVAPAASAASTDPIGSGQVKTIKAVGNVIVTSQKDDQKATSNEGFFEVKEQKIAMTGDVVMTQKGNIVKCAKLNIDLNTSKFVCIPTESVGANGAKKPGRVTAVLKRDAGSLPGAGAPSANGKTKQKQDKSATEAKPAPKTEAGWQTQSQ